MRRIIFALALFMVLTLTNELYAQSTTMKDAISTSFSLTDYYTNHLPDDSDRTFASTDLWEPGWGIAYGRNINKFINLNVPFHVRKSKMPQIDDLGFTNTESLLLGLDVTAHIGDWKGNGWFKPYLLAGIGLTHVAELGQQDLSFPVGGGFNFRLGKPKHYNAYLNVQSQYRIVIDEYRRNFVHSIGIVFPLGTGVIPPPPPKDTDGDGITDNCPDEVGPKENKGCPYPDRDGDGLFDKDDKCPDEAGPSSNNGCPELKKEDKETLSFAAQNIYFDTGKSVIKSSSFEIMDKVADILNRYPSYNCSIGGHTDSLGNAASNQKLSEKRAKACYDYLVSKGVSGTRLSYAGYGEAQPIADNKYKDGRDQNRRVEFNVYLK